MSVAEQWGAVLSVAEQWGAVLSVAEQWGAVGWLVAVSTASHPFIARCTFCTACFSTKRNPHSYSRISVICVPYGSQ